MLRLSLFVALISISFAQYAQNRNVGASTDAIPAWYQMAKPAASPSYPYERREPYDRVVDRPTAQRTNAFSGHPSYGSSRGSYPEAASLPTLVGSHASMGPHGSIGSQGAYGPPRRYPGGQDMPYESALSRYHKLLLKNKKNLRTTTRRPTTTTQAATTTWWPITQPEQPQKPKSLGNIYSTVVTNSPKLPTPGPELGVRPEIISTGPRPRVLPSGSGRPKVKEMNKLKWRKLTPPTTKATPTSEATPTPTKSTTKGPPRFICRHRPNEPLTIIPRTIPPFRVVGRTFKPRGSRRLEKTTGTVPTTTATRPQSLIDFLWPNSELLNAIKDVVAKFKASLDETGLDQDVRVMGNQLRNTWQQLRNAGPVNAQLGKLFEKAADGTVDVTDQRTLRD